MSGAVFHTAEMGERRLLQQADIRSMCTNRHDLSGVLEEVRSTCDTLDGLYRASTDHSPLVRLRIRLNLRRSLQMRHTLYRAVVRADDELRLHGLSWPIWPLPELYVRAER